MVRQLIEVKADLERTVRLRKKQLQLLVDISMMANAARDVDEAIAYALRRIAEYNGWSFGHAYLLDPEDGETLVPVSSYYTSDADRFSAFREATSQLRLRPGQGLPARALASGRFEWTDGISGDLSERCVGAGDGLGLSSAFAFPILTGTKTVGVLEFFSERTDRLEPVAQVPIASIGAQLGRVFERQSANRQLRDLVDRERARLARDLHDAVGQDLAGLAMSAESIARRLQAAGSREAQAVVNLSVGLRSALEQTRQIAHRLSKVPGGPRGLHEALRELARRVAEQSGVQCSIDVDPAVVIGDEETATHLYRIAQEALHNALKHAAPKNIGILLAAHPDGTTLEIRDDGVGLSDAADGTGMGLKIMQQRALLLGGRVGIERGERAGTVVRCVIPGDPERPVS